MHTAASACRGSANGMFESLKGRLLPSRLECPVPITFMLTSRASVHHHVWSCRSWNMSDWLAVASGEVGVRPIQRRELRWHAQRQPQRIAASTQHPVKVHKPLQD